MQQFELIIKVCTLMLKQYHFVQIIFKILIGRLLLLYLVSDKMLTRLNYNVILVTIWIVIAVKQQSP